MDTVDIVGFLAFEMVRSLTLAGLAVKKSLEESYLREEYSSPVLGKRKQTDLVGELRNGVEKAHQTMMQSTPCQPIHFSCHH